MARGKRARRGRGGTALLTESMAEEHDESSPPPAKAAKVDETIENENSSSEPLDVEKPSENGIEDSSSPQADTEEKPLENKDISESIPEENNVQTSSSERATEEKADPNPDKTKETEAIEEKTDSKPDTTKEKEIKESDKAKDLESKPKESTELKSILNAGPLPPGASSSYSCEICIKNLPEDVSEKMLKDELLESYQNDSLVRIEFTSKNEEKVAIVEFKRSLNATNAMHHINRLHKNKGSPFVAEINETSEEHVLAPSPSETSVYHRNATRKLYLGNLKQDATIQQIKSYLLKYGKVNEVVIKRGKLNTFAFISFDTIESTVKAIKGLQEEAQRDGLGLRVGFGRTKIEKAILISNLRASDLDILDFRKFVSYVSSLGFLFVDRDANQALLFFKWEDAACRALIHFRGRKFNGQRLMTDFAPHHVEKKYINLLPDKYFDRHGGLDVLRKRTFEIVNNKVTEIRQPLERKDAPKKSYLLEEVMEWLSGRDKEESGVIDPTQLIEIPGCGLYFIKSSFP